MAALKLVNRLKSYTIYIIKAFQTIWQLLQSMGGGVILSAVVILSASVKRCFVSRMRDFSFYFLTLYLLMISFGQGQNFVTFQLGSRGAYIGRMAGAGIYMFKTFRKGKFAEPDPRYCGQHCVLICSKSKGLLKKQLSKWVLVMLLIEIQSSAMYMYWCSYVTHKDFSRLYWLLLLTSYICFSVLRQ